MTVDRKISELTPVTTLTGAELIPLVQGGATKSATVNLIWSVSLLVAASDETTAITSGVGKVTLRSPFAFTVTGVRASLTTAQTSGNVITVDINKNGTSILSTKLSIDNGEETSVTATTAAVISSGSIASDDEITIDVDQIGDGTATGLKVLLTGNRA